MTQKFRNAINYLQEEADWYKKYICDDKEYEKLELEFLEAIKVLEREGGFKKVASGMVDYDKEYDGKIYIQKAEEKWLL